LLALCIDTTVTWSLFILSPLLGNKIQNFVYAHLEQIKKTLFTNFDMNFKTIYAHISAKMAIVRSQKMA